MEDVDDLIAHTQVFLADLGAIYSQSVANRHEGRRLRPMIGTILKEQRTVLDYLATDIHTRYGTGGNEAKPGYPLAFSPRAFRRLMAQKLPGVEIARPDLARAFADHQPYSADHNWLEILNRLRNQGTHARLIPIQPEGAGGFRTRSPSSVVFEAHASGSSEATGGAFPTGPVYTGWQFVDPALPVLPTLRAIQRGVEGVVADICAIADPPKPAT